MQSKTSFFNKTLFGKDLQQKVLPMGSTIFILFLVTVLIPAFMERDFGNEGYALYDVIGWMTNPIMIALFCILVVLTCFSYLYKRRDSYMLHSFPVSRRAHFYSHAAAGLIGLIVLTCLCYGCPVVFLKPGKVPAELILISFAETLIQILFFYGLSLFVMTVCGNVVLAFITYGVLNLLWFFINLFASLINYLLLWHPIALSYGNGNVTNFFMYERTGFLFPLYFFLEHTDNTSFVTEGDMIRVNVGHLGSCAWMLIPAVILIVLAGLLYEKKSLERTGEIVAFGWCKVVFRVLVTACGACLTATLLYYSIMQSGSIERGSAGNLVIVVILILIGGILSFLISEMLLKKTVHIFHGKRVPILQGIIPLGIVLLYVGLIASGVLAPKLVPDAEEVRYISVRSDIDEAKKLTITDPDAICVILEEQRSLVNDPELIRLAKLSRHQGTWSVDEANEMRNVHYAYFELFLMDEDGVREQTVLGYVLRDEDKQKVLGTAIYLANHQEKVYTEEG